MGHTTEERIYELVVEESGIPREKLTPDSRLSYDLGLEGDDAVEFFEKLEDEFKVDLSRLTQNWNHYFSAEGVSPVMAFIVLGPPLPP